MKIEIPEQKRLVYEMTLAIRWGDMDVLGHVNNTCYFRYMETVRLDWCRALGCNVGAGPAGMVIFNTFCNFIEPLKYPGEVLIRSYVGAIGRSSFDNWMTMARTDAPERLVATGGATVVWVDLARQKSAPLPDWLRGAIGPVLADRA